MAIRRLLISVCLTAYLANCKTSGVFFLICLPVPGCLLTWQAAGDPVNNVFGLGSCVLCLDFGGSSTYLAPNPRGGGLCSGRGCTREVCLNSIVGRGLTRGTIFSTMTMECDFRLQTERYISPSVLSPLPQAYRRFQDVYLIRPQNRPCTYKHHTSTPPKY